MKTTTTTTATKLAPLLRLSQKVYMREISIAMFLQIRSDTYIADFWKTNRTKFAGRQKAASCLGPISSKITLTKRKEENERAGKESVCTGSNIELGEGDFFLQGRCVGLCTLWEKHSQVVCLGL